VDMGNRRPRESNPLGVSAESQKGELAAQAGRARGSVQAEFFLHFFE